MRQKAGGLTLAGRGNVWQEITMGFLVWVVPLVLAAVAPWSVRALKTALEQRARRRTLLALEVASAAARDDMV
jgi:hypothetical protein